MDKARKKELGKTFEREYGGLTHDNLMKLTFELVCSLHETNRLLLLFEEKFWKGEEVREELEEKLRAGGVSFSDEEDKKKELLKKAAVEEAKQGDG